MYYTIRFKRYKFKKILVVQKKAPLFFDYKGALF